MKRKMIRSVFMLFMLALFACQTDDAFRGTELEGLPTTDFTLTDQHGQPFTLSEQKGKVVLIFFGFSFCPDVCPLTLSKWKQIEKQLGEQNSEVEFVYITVDPERDTQEKLKTHLAVFSDSFIGLTGTPDDLKTAYAGYGIYREVVKVSEGAAGYLVNHTSRIFVFDRAGNWRLGISNDSSVEDMVHDIRLLLKG